MYSTKQRRSWMILTTSIIEIKSTFNQTRILHGGAWYSQQESLLKIRVLKIIVWRPSKVKQRYGPKELILANLSHLTLKCDHWPSHMVIVQWWWTFASRYFKFLQLMKESWTKQAVLGQFIQFDLEVWPLLLTQPHSSFMLQHWVIWCRQGVLGHFFATDLEVWPWPLSCKVLTHCTLSHDGEHLYWTKLITLILTLKWPWPF